MTAPAGPVRRDVDPRGQGEVLGPRRAGYPSLVKLPRPSGSQRPRDLDAARGVGGRDITPYLPGGIVEITGGANLRANVALVRANAHPGTASTAAAFGPPLPPLGRSAPGHHTRRQAFQRSDPPIAHGLDVVEPHDGGSAWACPHAVRAGEGIEPPARHLGVGPV